MDDSSLAPELNNYTGLDCIDFYPLPHYIDEPFVQSARQTYAEYSKRLNLVTFNNSQAIVVINHNYVVV